jgi:hypothetical protein
MKRNVILTAIIAITMLSAFAGNQSTEKETRDLKGFRKINFGVSGNLYVNIGSQFSVVLEGDKDLLENIITEVSKDRLVIKKENWRMNMNKKVNVYVTMPEMTALGVSGSGRAEVKDDLKTGDLNLSVSGSGKLYTSGIEVSKLDCSISGSGDIILGSGNAETGDFSISGSGNFTGENTKIGKADISISGSGNCICNVTENLKGSISGSGNVSYLGDPKLDVRVSGSGKVRSK